MLFRSMLTGLTETVSKQQEMLEALTVDMAVVKADVSELKERVAELDARSLRSAVLLETEVAKKLQLLYEGHGELKRETGTLATKEQVEKLAEDVDVVKTVVTRHSGEISQLKKAR